MADKATNMTTAYTPDTLKGADRDMLISIIMNMQDTIHALSDNITQINERLAVMTSRQFGRSADKVEIPGQVQFAVDDNGDVVFFNETEATYDPAEETEDLEPAKTVEAPESDKPKVHRVKGRKAEKIQGLPIKPVPHTMTEEQLVAEFGVNGWKILSEDIQYRYHFQPAVLEIEEHHIAVYADKKNNGHVVRADHPKPLLNGSLVSPSIEAAIINSKFTNSCTYYRIEKEFERYGIEITRADMAGWTIRCAERYLAILYDYMKAQMLSKLRVIHADETVVEVSKDGRPAGSQSRMWVYRSGAFYTGSKMVIYDYQKTRNSSHPREFLKGFSGICVTDGYQVYHGLEKDADDIRIAGCWFHARRYFTDAIKAAGKGKLPPDHPACVAVSYIKAISEAEKKLGDLTPKERLRKRRIKVRPLVDAYFTWLKDTAQHLVSSTSKTGEGIAYSLNQEKYLRVFLEDGEVPISNNAAESTIRNFVIGRKNFVLIDTVNGAKTSAMIYSLVETAKANDLKIYEYFEHLLTEIPKHVDETDRSFCEELLPWSPDLPEHIRKPVKK